MKIIGVNKRSEACHLKRGNSRIDLLAIVAAGAMLIAIGTPTLWRAREMSRRMVCCQNLAGLGVTAKIYSGQNDGSWMVPAFAASRIDNGGIDYKNSICAGCNDDPGSVGNDRRFESYSETLAQPSAGSLAVSVTRSFWMLARSGDVPVQQFVCPSGGDVADPTQNVDLYYDFTRYYNVSYGYQVPFGPPETRPREGADVRQVFAADKSPYYVNTSPPTWESNGQPLDLESLPSGWRPYNSPNHGGRGNGEGQNCLYADTHVAFQRIPAVGVDSDNIYTVIANAWGDPFHKNIIYGDTVWHSVAQYPYPGQKAIVTRQVHFASTDSLIYP